MSLIRGCNLVYEDYVQTSFFSNVAKSQKLEQLDDTLVKIRSRYGHFSVQRDLMLADKDLSDIDAKNDHVIHPVALAL